MTAEQALAGMLEGRSKVDRLKILSVLLERLQAPNRAIDVAIHKEVEAAGEEVPPYTESMDATLRLFGSPFVGQTLIMPGWSISSAYGGMGEWLWWSGVGAHGRDTWSGATVQWANNTPAIALLRALVEGLVVRLSPDAKEID